MPEMNAFQRIDVTRVSNSERTDGVDSVATEEPLEIRIQGRSFAVIMRTPGADPELAAGFLLAERVLTQPDDLGTIEHCTDPSGSHPGNIVNVTLANRSADAIDRVFADRRQIVTSSACGLCGRQSIESLRTDLPALTAEWRVAAAVVRAFPAQLRAAQSVFDETGGLHAAGLFTASGHLDEVAEDVGRHNAVDKVIGRRLMRDLWPMNAHLLFVSGRASFEIVQKAFLAGIAFVGSVSAPSSLAIELAAESGVTLVGFVRGESFNVYTHSARIA